MENDKKESGVPNEIMIQAIAEARERRGKGAENNLKYKIGGKSVHSQLTPTEYNRFKRYVHIRRFPVEKSFNLAKKARR